MSFFKSQEDSKPNPYKDLGLPPQATPQAVREAYRQLSMANHQAGGDPERQRILNAAMEHSNRIQKIFRGVKFDPFSKTSHSEKTAPTPDRTNFPERSPRQTRSTEEFLEKIRAGETVSLRVLLRALEEGEINNKQYMALFAEASGRNEEALKSRISGLEKAARRQIIERFAASGLISKEQRRDFLRKKR